MVFGGFTARAVEFYAELEADNTREFWTAHKSTYESEVRDPMRELVAELEPEFGPGRVFRPQRNLRFSQDKTPYKTHQAAFVGSSLGVGYYVQLDAQGLLAGGGFRSHGADEVERYRKAVDDEASGTEVSTIVAALRMGGFEVEGDPLKTRPKGYAGDHPRLDLLRCRSLMATTSFGTPDWLATPKALDEVRAAWRAVRPLAEWSAAHVRGAD